MTAAVDPNPNLATLAALAEDARRTVGGQVAAHRPMPAPVAPSADPTPEDFIAANRIHIRHGSLFVDPYLVLHPRELAPQNEAALRKKLQLTYSVNNPSFFESDERTAIALNLGALIPVSAAARRSQLLDQVNGFNAQIDSGIDTGLKQDIDDKKAPFAAVVRDVIERPGSDPVGLELLKNSLTMYLMMREKLTQTGFLGKLTDYVHRRDTADQILADLELATGIKPIAIQQAAFEGGAEKVGALLGLDPRYVADVKALADRAAGQEFGYNLVEHWHLGRQLQGIGASLDEKIMVGRDARITAKIAEFRDRVHHKFEVPEPIQKEQQRVAQMTQFLEPVQRKLLMLMNYEICYSPEVTADDIAFYPGIYGLHRRAANNINDIEGTYRIYFSGHGDLKPSVGTFVHEVGHNFPVNLFSAAEVAKIDQLLASDQQRFGRFQTMMDTQFDRFEVLFKAYKTGNEQTKAAAIATANREFAAYDFYAEGLFPYLRDAHDFQFAVRHAYDTLAIDGARYNRSSYNSPQERLREVVSRFATIKQVDYRGEPEFLQFLAPGLNQFWEAHYIPKLEQLAHAIETGTVQTLLASTHRDEAAGPAVNGSAVDVNMAEEGAMRAAPLATIDAPSAALAIPSRLMPGVSALKSMNVCLS